MSVGAASGAGDAPTVTMVFSDLAGSTALGERLDPETLRRVLGGYFDDMRAALVSHGGTIEKIIGDAIVAVFDSSPSPTAGALRAVRAVADTQVALEVLNEVIEARWDVRLANRTGIATGTILVERLEAGHSVLSGEVVERAESMERAAPHLEALMDAATRDLVADAAETEALGEVPLKGSGEPVPAFLLRSVDREAATGGAIEGRACTVCGGALDRDARRCPSCGSYAEISADTRRTVSVVFADPKLGPATGGVEPPATAMTAAASRFFEVARQILERHGATVETFIGDAVMAVFGLPVRREDDALRAVRAAGELSAALPGLNEELADRWGVEVGSPIGVNTGEVVAGDAAVGQRLVTGDVVNVAARLEQSAAPGEVLLGGSTHRLVRDHVVTTEVEPLTLKGKSEPVPAFRLDGISDVGGRKPARVMPMVGREEELAALVAAFQQAIDRQVAAVVTVLGDAGAGKSTLLAEFEKRTDAVGAATVTGRCLPYGDGITFWPVIEIVRSLAEIDDDDQPAAARSKILGVLGDEHHDVMERIASVMGLVDTTHPVSEIFWATRRMFEIVGARAPLVVVVEDIHWAEQTLLDLVRHLEETIAASAVTIVCAARPALLEQVPDWGSGDGEALVTLQPLSDEDTARIIDNVLGTAGLGDRARERVTRAAEGNPLFVEQLLSMLIDDGRLRFDGERWVAAGDLDDLAIPPSIHALLASRIDRLPGGSRRVAEPASVIGKNFAEDAVRHLVTERSLAEALEQHLRELVERQIVETGDRDEGGAMYRFHHVLLRDAAYQGLLKETRAVFHEEFVEWADRVNEAAGRAQEFEEILGFHLEQSYRYWSELGPLDDHARAVGRDASRRLASAGRRAFDRGDMPAAASLLGRAAELLEPGDEGLAELLLRAGEARFETGDFDGAAAAVQRSEEVAAEAGDIGGAAAAAVERLRFSYLTGSAGSSADVKRRADDLRLTLEPTGHEAGLARAWRLLTTVEVVGARFGSAEEAAIEMVEHAARAGDRVMEMRILQNLAVLAPVGPTPVTRAIERCEEILRRVESDRRAVANTRRALASLHAMNGDVTEARRLYQQARSTLEELGWRHDAALVSLDSGPVELLAGDPAIAEAELRRDYDTLKEMGDTFFVPTTAVFLAEAVYRQGRFDEAEGLAAECAETADPDDLAPQVLWRVVAAKIAARRGEESEAVTLAREAVEMSGGSDGPTLQADALLGLTEVGVIIGAPALVAEGATATRSRYEAKGSLAGIRRLEAVLPAGA